eukprot:SAG22_NODE_824_length_6981_cov_2.752833_5_plen_602_part_01
MPFACPRSLAAAQDFTGEQCFQLYDTFGFPLDLTVMMCEEQSLTIEETTTHDGAYIVAGYDRAMEAQQLASKGNKGASGALVLEAEQTAWLTAQGIDPTDDSGKYTWNTKPTAEVKAIYKGKTQDSEGFVDSAASGEYAQIGIITTLSPFYAEQGGQTNDEGVLLAEVDGEDVVFEVTNAQVFGGFVLHIGELKGGTIKPGMSLEMSVDYVRRSRIAPNHTCTHSLNYALRKVLGQDGKVAIDQRGSLNNPSILRFDFTYKGQIAPADLEKVEAIVNEDIGKNLKVYIQESPLAEAKKINTLRAVFGEHYPDPVRVVSIGAPVPKLLADPENADWMQYSVEFCGGTHVQALGEATAFVLTKEESVAAGIRRITGVTGLLATQAIAEGKSILQQAEAAAALSGAALKAKLKELDELINKSEISAATRAQARAACSALEKRQVEADKATAAAKLELLLAEGSKLASDAEAAKAPVLIARIDALAADAKAGKSVATEMQKIAGSTVIVLLSVGNGKVLCMVSVPKELTKQAKAGDVIKATMPLLGGKGGGKPDFAQGQGSKVEGLAEAITAITNQLAGKLGCEAGAISTVTGPAEVAAPAAAEPA